MYIIIIRDHRKKLMLASAIVALWVLMFFTSNALFNNSLVLNITIDNYVSFSYPFKFEVENVFVNDILSENAIETSFSLKKPLAQKFSTFTSKNGKISFLYPSCFVLSQKDFAGSDILYHIDFKSSTKNTHGFVQVWNLPYSLEEFLEASKASSQQSYKSFTTEPVTINDTPGYYWDYSVLGTDNKYYHGSEVFLKRDDKMYRLSYFTPEELWNKQQSDIFWRMVKSLKTY